MQTKQTKKDKKVHYITTDMDNVAFPGAIHSINIDLKNEPANKARLELFKKLYSDTDSQLLNEFTENLVIVYRAGRFDSYPEANQTMQEFAIGTDEDTKLDLYSTGLLVKVITIEQKNNEYVLIYKALAQFEISKIKSAITLIADQDNPTKEAINKNLLDGKADYELLLASDIKEHYKELKSQNFSILLGDFVEKPAINKADFTNSMFQELPNDKAQTTTIKNIVKFYKSHPAFNASDEINYNFDIEFTIFSFLSKLVAPNILKYKLLYEFHWDSFDEFSKTVQKNIYFLASIENKINRKIATKLNEQQDDYMLRERYKTLKDMVVKEAELDEYQETLKNAKLSKRYPLWIQKSIEKETNRISEMMITSPEVNITKTYIDLMKKLPWRITQKEKLDINKVQETLDKYHYGLGEVKDRIIEHIAVLMKAKRVSNETAKKRISVDKNTEIDLSLFKENENELVSFNNVPILTLIGPPGTGKTSLCKAIAEALGRKMVKVSLGGVRDEAEIRGHRKTYVGAMPGKIIKAIQKAKISNPVILLDEIDKMSSDAIKGDPASAMLEVLDPEQNTKFQDHYLEHEYDLSKVIFIATANYYEGIPEALLDRVELIEVPAYTLSEKMQIARKHLLPKVIEQAYINQDLYNISDDMLRYIINHYTRESGVRGLKKVLDKIARKISKQTEFDKSITHFEIEPKVLDEFLGPIIYNTEKSEPEYGSGVVNGLAYTSYGGSLLQIEVNIFPGKSELKLTGSLKEVMQESAMISLSYVRANAEKFGVQKFNFDENIIHIHVPEGATPKDGPSAGVTFTTAILSAIKNYPIPTSYAMTGEITLRGRVLEIGGLREKSFAAYQRKIKYVFIPTDNQRNLLKVSNEIKSKIVYIPVETYDDIYNVLFLGQEPKQQIITCENAE
ncbi:MULTISPECIES: endopeptidase La [unclassified Mycoplasma]|uniref:endopeptidase La n=1 Tax=unclassified Mycoplasma TaxID=2683645 RepID=UPI00211B9F7B|nr:MULTISPECIES: endopeptidase La [unclassified Mycoplasma]UUM19558.1 endopeptidase La [Mycoplasma sp. 1578d]UUM24477.1 endopeptidase La [Mycoplasma sp. 3686d]